MGKVGGPCLLRSWLPLRRSPVSFHIFSNFIRINRQFCKYYASITQELSIASDIEPTTQKRRSIPESHMSCVATAAQDVRKLLNLNDEITEISLHEILAEASPDKQMAKLFLLKCVLLKASIRRRLRPRSQSEPFFAHIPNLPSHRTLEAVWQLTIKLLPYSQTWKFLQIIIKMRRSNGIFPSENNKKFVNFEGIDAPFDNELAVVVPSCKATVDESFECMEEAFGGKVFLEERLDDNLTFESPLSFYLELEFFREFLAPHFREILMSRQNLLSMLDAVSLHLDLDSLMRYTVMIFFEPCLDIARGSNGLIPEGSVSELGIDKGFAWLPPRSSSTTTSNIPKGVSRHGLLQQGDSISLQRMKILSVFSEVADDDDARDDDPADCCAFSLSDKTQLKNDNVYSFLLKWLILKFKSAWKLEIRNSSHRKLPRANAEWKLLSAPDVKDTAVGSSPYSQKFINDMKYIDGLIYNIWNNGIASSETVAESANLISHKLFDSASLVDLLEWKVFNLECKPSVEEVAQRDLSRLFGWNSCVNIVNDLVHGATSTNVEGNNVSKYPFKDFEYWLQWIFSRLAVYDKPDELAILLDHYLVLYPSETQVLTNSSFLSMDCYLYIFKHLLRNIRHGGESTYPLVSKFFAIENGSLTLRILPQPLGSLNDCLTSFQHSELSENINFPTYYFVLKYVAVLTNVLKTIPLSLSEKIALLTGFNQILRELSSKDDSTASGVKDTISSYINSHKITDPFLVLVGWKLVMTMLVYPAALTEDHTRQLIEIYVNEVETFPCVDEGTDQLLSQPWHALSWQYLLSNCKELVPQSVFEAYIEISRISDHLLCNGKENVFYASLLSHVINQDLFEIILGFVTSRHQWYQRSSSEGGACMPLSSGTVISPNVLPSYAMSSQSSRRTASFGASNRALANLWKKESVYKERASVYVSLLKLLCSGSHGDLWPGIVSFHDDHVGIKISGSSKFDKIELKPNVFILLDLITLAVEMKDFYNAYQFSLLFFECSRSRQSPYSDELACPMPMVHLIQSHYSPAEILSFDKYDAALEILLNLEEFKSANLMRNYFMPKFVSPLAVPLLLETVGKDREGLWRPYIYESSFHASALESATYGTDLVFKVPFYPSRSFCLSFYLKFLAQLKDALEIFMLRRREYMDRKAPKITQNNIFEIFPLPDVNHGTSSSSLDHVRRKDSPRSNRSANAATMFLDISRQKDRRSLDFFQEKKALEAQNNGSISDYMLCCLMLQLNKALLESRELSMLSDFALMPMHLWTDLFHLNQTDIISDIFVNPGNADGPSFDHADAAPDSGIFFFGDRYSYGRDIQCLIGHLYTKPAYSALVPWVGYTDLISPLKITCAPPTLCINHHAVNLMKIAGKSVGMKGVAMNTYLTTRTIRSRSGKLMINEQPFIFYFT